MDYKSGGKCTTIPAEGIRYFRTRKRVNAVNTHIVKDLGMGKKKEPTHSAT